MSTLLLSRHRDIIHQTVFIIDDDEAVRDSMSMLMRAWDMDHIAFESAEEFLEHYSDDLHGCLVLDIRMKGMTGMELQSALSEKGCILPIIFMTGHGDIPMAVKAMRRGAFDFLRKPIIESELKRRVDEAMTAEVDAVERLEGTREIMHLIELLTERESEVFMLVTDGESNKAIASTLDISERTVEVHRSNIMKKLGARTLAQLVRIRIASEPSTHYPLT